jgi:prolipoprotein diacylglyceryltransferase
MYPDFHSLFRDLFGINIPGLSLLKSFGFLVALSFFFAGYTLYKELKRKEDDGLIGYTISEITIGKPTTIIEYILNSLYGFIIGYKLVGMFQDRIIASPDPMNYLFSSKGNVLAGVVLSIIFFGVKLYDNYLETKRPFEIKKVKTYPSIKVPDIAMIAAVAGFAGAKIFNAFENWDDFLRDPIGSLISSSGLTFYGGLLLATTALYFYSRKLKFDFKYLCDAAAPGLILAYAIGRLGCQVSGDGDWGIYNSAYITEPSGKVALASSKEKFDSTVLLHKAHFDQHFKEYEKVPRAYFKKPAVLGFLPDWFVAYSYPNNVNNIGIPIQQTKIEDDEYNSMLPSPVFPTPIYEFIAGTCIFFFLWYNRKKWKTPLTMFSIYLIFNGLERFFIEQIRVNSKYNWGFIHPTQAEIIAVCLILSGSILLLLRKKIA